MEPFRNTPLGTKVFQQMAALRARMIPFVLEHRREVMIGFVLVVLALEFTEHLLVVRFGETIHLVYDVVIYTLLFPAIIWVMISLLDSTESQREKADQANDLRSEFSQKLGSVQDWSEMVHLIVQYAHQVAPQARATLFVCDHESNQMHVEAVCDFSGQVTLSPRKQAEPTGSPILPKNGRASAGDAHLDPGDPPLAAAPLRNRYDLPVTRNDQPIGLLKLEYAAGCGPATEEINALKGVEPLIALALEGMQLQNLAIEQAAYSEAQRQQIAQNLHDSLAQNISYLRLKLDQLTGENAIHEINVVLQELERMRASADEAYQQVRNTLDELNPSRADDLVTSLLKQARIISQRSGLTLRSSQLGAPYNLPTPIRQQIVYITREALHNVEKHAFAHQVHLQFLWLDTELILKITDDGVGFNPISITAEGHYGLWIMQHRAQEIGGSLTISSLDAQEDGGSGTEVTLWVPRSDTPPVNTGTAIKI